MADTAMDDVIQQPHKWLKWFQVTSFLGRPITVTVPSQSNWQQVTTTQNYKGKMRHMTHPLLPADRNRSTRSLCWGRATLGRALCLSSSCMSSTWQAFPLAGAQTTSQTSTGLLWTFQDHPPTPERFSLLQQWDPGRSTTLRVSTDKCKSINFN